MSKETRQERLHTAQVRRRQAQIKIQEKFIDNLKKNTFNLNKWDLIRKKRAELIAHMNKLKDHSRFA